MDIFSTYSVKIKHYNKMLVPTVKIYRNAVDFFLTVILNEWDDISKAGKGLHKNNFVERLTIRNKNNTDPKYPFEDMDKTFYKMPVYLRRAAIAEALGKASSYKSNYANWENAAPDKRGDKPSLPKAGYVFPSLYRENMYRQTDSYKAQIKVFVHNTWEWLDIQFRKSDIDYIRRHCAERKHCVPTLQKRGKEWFLDFTFEEKVTLTTAGVNEQTIAAVDLGINSAATVSIMRSDGTILARRFLSLTKEQDSLTHAVNRIKKAQQHGSYKTPRLWATAKGINDDIAVKTAHFIIDAAVLYSADVIVFEHLDVGGKKKGSKKQKLHLWKCRYVQSMVEDKAHRCGMRISHINAWGTSRLAYDGSGRVLRGRDSAKTDGSYSVCEFPNGKVYNCDLNATYNIGARYFIREILKSLSETARLGIEAKVPQCTKRSTCTFSTLISLNAALAS